jgi:hypothetical protein
MGQKASAAAALGVYKPRRPQASPLFRLVSDHVQRLQTVYDERFDVPAPQARGAALAHSTAAISPHPAGPTTSPRSVALSKDVAANPFCALDPPLDS